MKKCNRCNLIFHVEERIRCLYCDTLLYEITDENRKSWFDQDSSVPSAQLVRQKGDISYGRLQYIISSYFRVRTLHFMYSFSRNDMRMGKEFKRFFIQPVNVTSFLSIPWLLVNLCDSVFFRMFYNGFDSESGWKYVRLSENQSLTEEERSYCKEYKDVVDDILSGKICQTEGRLKEIAKEKLKVGKRSAYNDLCNNRKYFSGFLDIMTIWFSVCLLLVAMVWAAYPFVLDVVSLYRFRE